MPCSAFHTTAAPDAPSKRAEARAGLPVDRDGVPAVLEQRGEHAGAGVERHLALGGQPTHHDGDPATCEAMRHG
jgi:hypothetical protein